MSNRSNNTIIAPNRISNPLVYAAGENADRAPLNITECEKGHAQKIATKVTRCAQNVLNQEGFYQKIKQALVNQQQQNSSSSSSSSTAPARPSPKIAKIRFFFHKDWISAQGLAADGTPIGQAMAFNLTDDSQPLAIHEKGYTQTETKNTLTKVNSLWEKHKSCHKSNDRSKSPPSSPLTNGKVSPIESDHNESKYNNPNNYGNTDGLPSGTPQDSSPLPNNNINGLSNSNPPDSPQEELDELLKKVRTKRDKNARPPLPTPSQNPPHANENGMPQQPQPPPSPSGSSSSQPDDAINEISADVNVTPSSSPVYAPNGLSDALHLPSDNDLSSQPPFALPPSALSSQLMRKKRGDTREKTQEMQGLKKQLESQPLQLKNNDLFLSLLKEEERRNYLQTELARVSQECHEVEQSFAAETERLMHFQNEIVQKKQDLKLSHNELDDFERDNQSLKTEIAHRLEQYHFLKKQGEKLARFLKEMYEENFELENQVNDIHEKNCALQQIIYQDQKRKKGKELVDQIMASNDQFIDAMKEYQKQIEEKNSSAIDALEGIEKALRVLIDDCSAAVSELAKLDEQPDRFTLDFAIVDVSRNHLIAVASVLGLQINPSLSIKEILNTIQNYGLDLKTRQQNKIELAKRLQGPNRSLQNELNLRRNDWEKKGKIDLTLQDKIDACQHIRGELNVLQNAFEQIREDMGANRVSDASGILTSASRDLVGEMADLIGCPLDEALSLSEIREALEKHSLALQAEMEKIKGLLEQVDHYNNVFVNKATDLLPKTNPLSRPDATCKAEILRPDKTTTPIIFSIFPREALDLSTQINILDGAARAWSDLITGCEGVASELARLTNQAHSLERLIWSRQSIIVLLATLGLHIDKATPAKELLSILQERLEALRKAEQEKAITPVKQVKQERKHQEKENDVIPLSNPPVQITPPQSPIKPPKDEMGSIGRGELDAYLTNPSPLLLNAVEKRLSTLLNSRSDVTEIYHFAIYLATFAPARILNNEDISAPLQRLLITHASQPLSPLMESKRQALFLALGKDEEQVPQLHVVLNEFPTLERQASDKDPQNRLTFAQRILTKPQTPGERLFAQLLRRALVALEKSPENRTEQEQETIIALQKRSAFLEEIPLGENTTTSLVNLDLSTDLRLLVPDKSKKNHYTLEEQLKNPPPNINVNSAAKNGPKWCADRRTRNKLLAEIIKNTLAVHQDVQEISLDEQVPFQHPEQSTTLASLSHSQDRMVQRVMQKKPHSNQLSPLGGDERTAFKDEIEKTLLEQLTKVTGLQATPQFIQDLAHFIKTHGRLPRLLLQVLSPAETLAIANLFYYHYVLNSRVKQGFELFAHHQDLDWLIEGASPRQGASRMLAFIAALDKSTDFHNSALTPEQANWGENTFRLLSGKPAKPLHAAGGSGKTATTSFIIPFLKEQFPNLRNKDVHFLAPFAVEPFSCPHIKRTQIQNYNQKEMIIPVENDDHLDDVVVIDESHLLQTNTEIFLQSKTSKNKKKPNKLCITATPVTFDNDYPNYRQGTIKPLYAKQYETSKRALEEARFNLQNGRVTLKQKLITEQQQLIENLIRDQKIEKILESHLPPNQHRFIPDFLKNFDKLSEKISFFLNLNGDSAQKEKKQAEKGEKSDPKKKSLSAPKPAHVSKNIKPLKGKEIDIFEDLQEEINTLNRLQSNTELSAETFPSLASAIANGLAEMEHQIHLRQLEVDALKPKIDKWNKPRTVEDDSAEVRQTFVKEVEQIHDRLSYQRGSENAFNPETATTAVVEALKATPPSANTIQLIFPKIHFGASSFEPLLQSLHKGLLSLPISGSSSSSSSSTVQLKTIRFVYHDSHSGDPQREGHKWVVDYVPSSSGGFTVSEPRPLKDVVRGQNNVLNVLLYDTTNKQGGDFNDFSKSNTETSPVIAQYIFNNLVPTPSSSSSSSSAPQVTVLDLLQEKYRTRQRGKKDHSVLVAAEEERTFFNQMHQTQREIEQTRAIADATVIIFRKLAKIDMLLDNPSASFEDTPRNVYIQRFCNRRPLLTENSVKTWLERRDKSNPLSGLGSTNSQLMESLLFKDVLDAYIERNREAFLASARERLGQVRGEEKVPNKRVIDRFAEEAWQLHLEKQKPHLWKVEKKRMGIRHQMQTASDYKNIKV